MDEPQAIAQQLQDALQAHHLYPSDFGTTLEAMNSAAPGTTWKCQKGDIHYTVIKNNQTSYNVQTDQYN